MNFCCCSFYSNSDGFTQTPTGDFNLSTPLTYYEKNKSPQRGIEPGSSGRKARLITIRPRDGLLETECFFIDLNHLNFSRISKIGRRDKTHAPCM